MKVLSLALLLAGMLLAVVGYVSKDSAVQAQAADPAGAARPKELVLDLGDKVTLKLVQIPAGKFIMGSPEEEKKTAIKEAVAAGESEDQAAHDRRFNDEVQHEVTISKPFYMGVTHVTVDQFAAFVKDSGYKTDAEKSGRSIGVETKDGRLIDKITVGCSWRNPSFYQKGDHPVVQVSWNDAQAFCAWLSRKSGKTVALPTEAQWEYACRAGTKTAYPWGDNPDDGKGWANCADQSLKKKIPNEKRWAFFSWDDGYAFTSPVGSFRANAFGLYDMIGNAEQWCQDRYGPYEKRVPTTPGYYVIRSGEEPKMGATTYPTGADAADYGVGRVHRGGSWMSDPKDCRSAVRGWFDQQTDAIGFRVSVSAGVDLP